MDGWMDIQTDGDYTKRVVTPFGTTRLKILDPPPHPAAVLQLGQEAVVLR